MDMIIATLASSLLHPAHNRRLCGAIVGLLVKLDDVDTEAGPPERRRRRPRARHRGSSRLHLLYSWERLWTLGLNESPRSVHDIHTISFVHLDSYIPP